MSKYDRTVKMGDEAELIAQGWRRCAIGQKTTQWCAEAERVRDELREQIERMEKALKNIRSISHINSAMNQNPFTLAALLAEIHYIAGTALAKEKDNEQ